MLLLLCLLLVDKHPIELQIRGQYLVDTSNWIDHQLTGHAGIDRFFVIDDHRVRILDTKGKIIHDFNKRGQGPGELMRPTNVIWDGFHYYVNASMEHRLHIFDEDFLWVDQLPMGYVSIYPFGVERKVVGQLIEPVFSSPNLLGPMFVNVEYDGQVLSEGKRFGKYRQIMKDWQFFFSVVFMWRGMNGMTHVAYSYDGNVQIYNQKGEIERVRSYPLRGFEKVDDTLPEFGKNLHPNVYLRDKSFMVNASGFEDKAVFVYKLPKQDYPFELALFEGESSKYLPLNNRIFFGVYGDKIYFLKEESTDQDYFYFLETWDWRELWKNGF